MDVSIVIVNWNTRDLLRDCLRSIFQEIAALTFEVFVIDNCSRDDSAAMVREEFPVVTMIANTQNRGFAAANNQGIRAAEGRYVLLLNPDTVVLGDAIATCVAFADEHADAGVVGCQVLLDEHTIQRTGFAFPGPWNLFLVLTGLSRAFPGSRFFGKPELGWWDRDTECDLDVISGMFMLVRAEAIAQVGAMDESYFVYAEEADWCYRLARAGWRRIFTPAARILHRDGGGNSSSLVSVKMYVQLQKSILIFFRKNLGLNAWIAGKAIYVVSDLIRLLVFFVLFLLKSSPRLRSKAFAAGAALRFHVIGVEPR